MNRSATKTRNERTFTSRAYLERLMGELDRAAICQRIGQAREEAGLTQPELADLLQPPVHWRTIQTWESVRSPRVPWDRLDEIARITGRSRDWLLHGDETVSATAVERLEAAAEVLAAEVARLAAIADRLEGQAPPQAAAAPD
jgi:DNA-binding transcriptional regulator YiaG